MNKAKSRANVQDDFDNDMDRKLVNDGLSRVGYLFNIKPSRIAEENRKEVACVLLYFAEESGEVFKCQLKYEPYFYVLAKETVRGEVLNALSKHFGGTITSVKVEDKVDLDKPNHLSGIETQFIKLSFKNVQDLTNTRNLIRQKIRPNKKDNFQDYLEAIEDTREHDVIYYTRVCIDLNIRCGLWYNISFQNGAPILKLLPEKIVNPNLRILAFDLETFKQPLKFPDKEKDPIMMISYMIDGQGFLIINREIVLGDIEDFEYTPKPEYEGKFSVFNEQNEQATLRRFFDHIRETKPIIFVTFNGDFFDWPYVKIRCGKYGMDMEKEIGVFEEQDEFKGRASIHMDCFYWVKRDAYLPQGSHGLKKVTKAKLGYDPVELDPEEMVPYARERPNELAAYSVSDAVATFYLYKKMIHDFIFALSTIIPMYPDDILRKGSGTLCELLLMAQAYSRRIIFPNKTLEQKEKFYNGNLVESETYIGGHVECLQVGVYRSDIPTKFKLNPNAYQKLIDQVDQTIDFCAQVEQNTNPNEISNREEIKSTIIKALDRIKENCNGEFKPLIYHLDVGAMYPNIILSNRLQPTAIVNETICSACLYNNPENRCKRVLSWEWRGELYPLKKGEYEGVKAQLTQESFNGIPFSRLPAEEQQTKLRERVKEYCRKAYNSVHTTKKELKSDTVCMRENSFYVDTVRAFRDRRYEYKNLVKISGNSLRDAASKHDVVGMKEAEERMSLYESLQLAHKIILNSFYGYVMRKGARWYSMEMAGMVTHMGANIITDSRHLVEQIGKPLELDTDGIWCLLPAGFPETFFLQTINGKKLMMSYPCSMLNLLIYDSFKNDQYQDVVGDKKYIVRTEMSVFFEIDGPYRAMIIPASTEENKMLKKRYAIFNMAGKLTEIKGFELKRRGELKLIKVFQEEIFDTFLTGSSLMECYKAAGAVADRWWDILEYKGAGIDIDELIDFLCENRLLSKSVEEYGAQKATSITAAKRLAEILGPEIIKDKGLNCKILISKKPDGATVTERALPSVVFLLPEAEKLKYLRLWLKEPVLKDPSIQSVIDWEYYKERLGTSIQKIITIPAALQKISNPTPRIPIPDWLSRRAKDTDNSLKQTSITNIFKAVQYMPPKPKDIEDIVPPKPMIPALLEIKNPPNFLLNFSEWHKVQKPAWIQRRHHNLALKKLRRDGNIKNQAPKSISSYLKSKDTKLLYCSWHVIGMYQGVDLGLFKLWIMTEFKELYCITLEVRRHIYISSRTEKNNDLFKSVKMTLPHNKTTNFLYEYEMTEPEYEENKFLLNNALADADIEGIYESKVPIEILAIISLGSVLKPKVELLEHILEAQGNLLGHVFKVDDFEVKNDAKYLSDINCLHKFFLFSVNAGVRSMWALFQPDTRLIDVFIIMPGHGDKPSMQKIFKDCLKDNSWVVNTQYPKKEDQMLRMIDKIMKEQSKPSIIFLSTTRTINELRTSISSIIQSMPAVELKWNNFSFPSLDWQRACIAYICNGYFETPSLIKEQIGLSTYSGIPLGNFPQDSIMFVCDVLFARSLKSNRCLIWWSEEGMPDMGGEDFVIVDEKDFQSTELCNPGFYTEIVAELDLGVLATNAILCYKHLFSGETIENNPSDERVVCLNAFRKVRSIVNTWIDDVRKHENSYADQLAMNSYRWIASRTSKMYDPLLHLTVHKLICQLFNHLLAEISKIGVKVIYAHSDKLIITTNKYEEQDAQNFCTFIIKTLTNTQTFAYLTLKCLRFWKVLLFKDIYNYSGIPIASEDEDFKIHSSFQMLDMFNDDIKKLCLIIIAQILYDTYNFLVSDYEQEKDRARIVEEIKAILSGEIKPKLFEYVSGMNKVDFTEFPKKVGAQFKSKHPSLEFIKVITHLIGLDIDLYEDMQSLRKNLLRLIGFSDFSPETEFIEPCASLVLPEIICGTCLYTRDIDFCRDIKISAGIWECSLCGGPFNKPEFEEQLIFLLKNKIRDFQTQDLQCNKCRMNKGGLLSRYCPCSGKFFPTRDAKEFEKILSLIKKVAKFHDFRYVHGIAKSIMANDN